MGFLKNISAKNMIKLSTKICKEDLFSMHNRLTVKLQ